MNNTLQKRKLKVWRQAKREAILKVSFKKPRGENLCIYLGGVIQKSK